MATAWKGIPDKAVGGPCTFGPLTMFHPSLKALTDWIPQHRQNKCDAKSFGPDCNSEVEFWNPSKRVFSSLVAPVDTAHALNIVNKLGCWLVKEGNTTSNALTGLLTDADSVHQETLQNRAAIIDFLLLAQGQVCEDFTGMCCMTLSDHFESIHKSIQELKELSGEQQQKSHPWDEIPLAYSPGWEVSGLGLGLGISWFIYNGTYRPFGDYVMLATCLSCIQEPVLSTTT